VTGGSSPFSQKRNLASNLGTKRQEDRCTYPRGTKMNSIFRAKTSLRDAPSYESIRIGKLWGRDGGRTGVGRRGVGQAGGDGQRPFQAAGGEDRGPGSAPFTPRGVKKTGTGKEAVRRTERPTPSSRRIFKKGGKGRTSKGGSRRLLIYFEARKKSDLGTSCRFQPTKDAAAF